LELEQRDYQVLAEFRYQVRRFLHFSEQAARAAGVEPQQHQLLLAIQGLPDGHEPTIGELAERLQLQHHSADELVDRAEKRGLVQRRRAQTDRRRVLVTLTPDGSALLRGLAVSHREELRAAAPALRRALAALDPDLNSHMSGANQEPDDRSTHPPDA
jgi:DNA-binding MarR family transcriptional regulator